MSDIPSELFRKILLRVPADSLLRFSTVCKAWRAIIGDASFIRSHATNQSSSTTLVIANSTGTRLFSLSPDSLDYNNDAHQVIDVMPLRTLYRTCVPRLPALPVASCNGLMLLSHYDVDKIWAVFNPVMQDFHEVSEFDHDSRLIGTGLGYCSASDDYKVVRIDEILRHGKIVYRTCIYSLRSGFWKVINDCPSDFPWLSPGVYLNGALYWRSWDFVIALDLKTENYDKLPLPPDLGKPFETRVDALGGCLILSCYYMMNRIDGWMMKDCEWVKLFTFGEGYGSGTRWNLRPVAYFKSKGQVFLLHDSGFFMLDIERNLAKNVTIDGLPEFFSCQFFPGSILPLDESYAVEVKSSAGTKRKRKKKTANKVKLTQNLRFKHDVTITDVLPRSDPIWSSEDDV
ncbi:PREDICTED: F-box protein CPR30-like [Erythranthe guttata]|uniref:F-box protein CPR30-like n=1 Tax=Erythranthe guttata TaxID=4155 RepID=UPI00064DB693|nr:PREDICTED: F-box protein CPR30-like [Erythranthe guttata]|eukprot:XP_012851812.1 PREDICTED: F-box protein CPR30-like [Erythranthe guttata]